MDIYTYPVDMARRDGKYWASSEAFPGLLGIGDTAEEAKANILTAMRLYIEDCLAEHRPIPVPGARRAHTVTIRV